MAEKIKYDGEIKGFPLIKIQSREIVEKTQAGSFWMTSLRKYREIYKKYNDNIIGDPNEGKLLIHDAIFHDPKSGKRTVIEDGAISTANEDDFVFCMFAVNPEKHSTFQFDEDQKQKLIGFNDTALLITDAYEFIKRVEKAANEKGYEIEHGFVQYYDETFDDIVHLVNLVSNGIGNIVFHKTKEYLYQQEFRFTIKNATGKDSLELHIGNLSDISKVFTVQEILKSNIVGVN